jgi:type IV secretion system protein VirB10
MNMARRNWKIAIIVGSAVAFVIVMVIMFGLQKPDNVMAEGEENTAQRNNTGSEFGASGLGGSGIIGADGAEAPPPEAGVVAETPPDGSAPPATTTPAEEDPKVAFAREQERRKLEAQLAEEAAAREAKNLALNGVIGQGIYQPDPTVLDELASGGAATVPSLADSGLETSLDPSLAALTGGVQPPTGTEASGGNRPAATGANDPVDLTAQQGSGVAAGSGPDVGYLTYGAVQARSPYEIKKGSVIPATLISEVNSDLPGSVTAQVRDDVYDTTTGGSLLIPKGARLFGRYDSEVEYGQRRAVVLWSHLVFPDGSTLLLEDMMGADAAGRSGFADKRRGNFLTMVAGNLLFSVLDAGERAAQAQIAESVTGSARQSDIDQLVSQVSRGTSGTGGGSAASVFNAQTAGTKPTLMIRTGYRFNIMVGKDIILEPWQG